MSIRDVFDDGEAKRINPVKGETNLPPGFWEAHPVLTHMRDRAWGSLCSPDSVFAAELALIAARVPHEVGIDSGVGAAPTGVSMLVALVGPPGSGKSESMAIAQAILNDRSKTLIEPVYAPLGSGEGIAETFMGFADVTDPVTGVVKKNQRVQVAHNAYFTSDEGQSMVLTGSRSGATIFPTLRSMWSGKMLGSANASLDRRRIVPDASYHASLVVGFQPQTMAPLFSDIEVDAGTPQRFLLASAIDPNMPRRSTVRKVGQLDWEMPDIPVAVGYHFPRRIYVDAAISAVIEDTRQDVHTGKVVLSAYDRHRNLMRLKVACLIGLLLRYRGSVEPFMVTERDWELAEAVVRCSDHVRDSVLEAAKAVEARELSKVVDITIARTKGVEKARAESREEQDTERVLVKVRQHPGKTQKELKYLFNAKTRPPVKEVLDALVASKDIEARTDPAPITGTDKVTYWPLEREEGG